MAVMDSRDLHYCEAFPDNTGESSLPSPSQNTRESSLPSLSQNRDQFLNINVILTETKVFFNPRKGDFDCFNDNTTEYQFTNIPLALLESRTLRILSEIGVPEDARDSMTFKFLACARTMAQTTHRTRKLLPMCVLIYVTTNMEEEIAMNDTDEEEESMDDSDEEQQQQQQDGFSEELREDQLDTNLVPADVSHEELEELERLKIGESKLDIGRCTVCLETYAVGSEAIRLPCLHLYHENCIKDWLQTGNSWSCPLCRFRIPRSINKDP